MFHVKKPITLKIALGLIHSKCYNFYFYSFKKEINRGEICISVENLSFGFKGVSTSRNSLTSVCLNMVPLCLN